MGEAARIQFEFGNGSWMRVQAVAPGTFRIRVNETGRFAEPPLFRYGIVSAADDAEVTDEEAAYGEKAVIEAGSAILQIDRDDGRFRLYDADGTQRLRAYGSPWASESSGFGVKLSLAADDVLYGLGNTEPEHIQRRGMRVSIWAERHLSASAPIPFLMSSSGWAIMMNTVMKHQFDIGCTVADCLSIEGEQGELDFFLFTGDSYGELLHAYTDIAGKPQLLPIWMYGLNFCPRHRSSARDVLEDAIKFRKSGTPCDLIGLSSDWTETMNDHSTSKQWHPERFPTSQNDLLRKVSFIGILQKQGFKLSLTIGCDYDLTLLEEKQALGTGAADDALARDEAGRDGNEAEPWYDHLRKFVDDGITAFVVSVSNPTFYFPERVWGNGMTSAELHNLYPVLAGKQMHHGFREQTKLRPVVHMERGYSGMQQFVVSTTGTFYTAGQAITAVLNYGLSGHVNTSTNMHLITREGIHSDFLLTWSRIHSQDHFHHPDFLERSLQQLFHRYARLRYRLIPYIYAAAHVAARTGMPVTRAMPLMFPDDPECRDLCRQYMLGEFLLVVVYTDQVYLPKGEWIDYWTGERYFGPLSFTYRLPPQAGGPLFVRAGAIITLWPEMDYIGQLHVETLMLDIYPGSTSSRFVLHEDDGATFDYLEGRIARTAMEWSVDGDRSLLRIARREGDYTGMAEKRSYELVIHTGQKPAAIRVGGQRRPDQTRRVKADLSRGWRYDRVAGTVRLVVEEAGVETEAVTVELLYAPEISIGSEIGGRARHEGASRTGSGEEEAADGLFVSALDANEPERAEAALAAWWASRRKKDGLTAAAWLIHVMNGSHLIVRHAERNGWTLEDIFGETANEAIAFNRLQTAEQGYELLLRLVRGYMQHEEASCPAAARHPAIRTLFAIVQREAEEDLSLNAMAARLALHPFHLSRLFKKETGQAYSEYVTAVRMKRARKLLEVGHKVYEVAVRSGFSDAGNFSKAFSKYWGVSPVSFKSKRS